MTRREFLSVMAVAGAGGLPLDARAAATGGFYDLPPFGNVSLLHFTDSHAQLLPRYLREPSMNLGLAADYGRPPHLVGEALLREFGLKRGSPEAYAFTHLDFVEAAHRYGKVGGFAHLSTLVKQLRGSRREALLLDGGDTWQGSATALWTRGQDMVKACRLLGVDVMTGHWEFTLGAERVLEIIARDLRGRTDFVAQNVFTADFDDAVFPAYVIRPVNGIPVAVVGQAFPYTPIANPRYLVPNWTFGIREERLQEAVNTVRARGAQVVVCLSHNGMDVDLKLASRVRGIDAILGGHTHDAIPAPSIVSNAGGRTLVTNAGSNGKFLGVLDLVVRKGKVVDYRHHLLPVFANLLPADPEMQALIDRERAPYLERLNEKLAVTEGVLYRRGTFNGSFDEVILDALLATTGAQVAFTPGFRWGTCVLPGEAILMEDLMNQTAITYPYTSVTTMTGASIKALMEDLCDNVAHPDPYYRQGGDMLRTGGLQYTCKPGAKMGSRILDVRIGGKALDAAAKYKVASWAPLSEAARDAGGEPIWDVVARYLRDQKVVKIRKANTPRLKGVEGNPGLA